MASEGLVSVANQLAHAVETSLDPQVPHEKRVEAYSVCEQFKEESPLCVECSLYLSANGTHVVRHFGLQLMEHCVKYKWYTISQAEKVSIKEASMSLLESAESQIAEHVHLKDALSRVVVEMMKREWPQHWPTLLPHLFEISYKGSVQAELVLLIFLRLIEDVAVLQTMESPQRRRDLHQVLIVQMHTIFSFILNLMEKHFEYCQHLSQQFNQHVRVVKLALVIFCDFIEWAPLNHILFDNGRLMHALCVVISQVHFQNESAECFLQLLNRKMKYDDVKLISRLFFNTNIVAKFSDLYPTSASTFDESNYSFAKKMSEILLGMSNCLCCTLSKCDGCLDKIGDYVNIPELEIHLEMLVKLCDDNSYIIQRNAISAWNSVFKNPVLIQSELVLQHIPRWVNILGAKVVRPQYPTISDETVLYDITVKYIIYDFDCEESFLTFFFHYRSELLDSFRQVVLLDPELLFSYIEQWLKTNVQKVTSAQSTGSLLTTEESADWEGLTTLMDNILSNFPSTYTLPLDRGLRLIDLCLNLKTNDADVLSYLLSCISYLLVFINNASQQIKSTYLPLIVQTIFSALMFRSEGNQSPRFRSIKSLKRHGGSLMIKISTKYPNLILPIFDDICVIYDSFKKDVNPLSKMEVILLLEALLSVNNHFNNYDRQNAFIRDVISEVVQYWMNTCVKAFSDYNSFMSFIGLDVDSITSDDKNTFVENRSKLIYCMDVIAAVVKRSTYPEDTEKLVQGGFLVSCVGSNASSVYRHPATPHIQPLLPNIFLLVKTLNSLWLPEAMSKLPSVYEKVFELSELEYKLLVGINGLEKTDVWSLFDPITHTSFISMQNFLIALYESCLTILLKSSLNLGRTLYELPNFAIGFNATVFYNFNNLPDYRLRMIVKQFLRSFIINCPTDMYDVLLVPILEYFTSIMLERLSNKWSYLAGCGADTLNEEQEDANNKELVDNLLNVQLSREYMDIIRTILIASKHATNKSRSDVFHRSTEDSVNNSPYGSQSNLPAVTSKDTLSELGVKVIEYEPTRNSIMLFLLHVLSWNDSTNSLKATMLFPVIVSKLVADNNITPDSARQILISLLQAVELHGQHDANIGSLLNVSVLVYEMLRPSHRQLLDVLAMVPGINLTDLNKFDQKVLQGEYKGKVDKGRKEMFKKLINKLIGRNIGQLYKKKEYIRDLPHLDIYRKKGQDLLNSKTVSEIGIVNFFQ